MGKEAFIIMQIGNFKLDRVCSEAIVPAIEACGLDAKRVDKHNQGDLLKSEIVRFIKCAEIIVADLTNERPNCYLEVGYAMGAGKQNRIVLTAREDHLPDSENHVRGGPKIHFDLSGYEILFWREGKLEEFRKALEKKIRQRLRNKFAAGRDGESLLDADWVSSQRNQAAKNWKSDDPVGLIEVVFSLGNPTLKFTVKELRERAQAAAIPDSPLMRGLEKHGSQQPTPMGDGISNQFKDIIYWYIRTNGDFFLIKTLYEDLYCEKNKIHYDCRIQEITHALLFAVRLYKQLAIADDQTIHVEIRHSGLNGRTLGYSGGDRPTPHRRHCVENEIRAEMKTTIGEIENDLTDKVKDIVSPLLSLFEYFKFDDDIYEEQVQKAKGRIKL